MVKVVGKKKLNVFSSVVNPHLILNKILQMKLTNNFSLSEFECNCGCKMPADVLVNIKILAIQLQYIRDYIDRPITLTNAYRCPAHNKKVGGVPNSQHVTGMAADIKIDDMKSIFVHPMINNLIKNGYIIEGGLGLYDSFTHYDIRGHAARWDFRKNR
jgi:hypothetical protein